MNRKLVWKRWSSPFQIPEDDEEEDEELSPWEKQERGTSIKAISGPFGIMPLSNINSIEKEFKIWLAHTNFPITINDQTNIINTYGIEAYNILSPYRFRIAIARLYNSKEVKNEICVKLGIDKYMPERVDIRDITIQNVKRLLSNNYKYWAICLSNNKPMVTVGDNNLNIVKQKLSNLSCEDVHKNF